MKIDYNLSENCKKRFYIDSNLQYGYRHLFIVIWNLALFFYTCGKVSFINFFEYLYHLCIGLLEIVPIVGHIVSFIDFKCNYEDIKIIYLKSINPYDLGLEQARLLRKEILFSLDKTVMLFVYLLKKAGGDPLQKAKELEPYIPKEYREEMRGIADGLGVPYERILILNTIVDTINYWACSMYAVSHDTKTGKQKRSYVTNYFSSLPRDSNTNLFRSHERYDDLESCNIYSLDIKELKKALLKTNMWVTVQSMVFDSETRDIYLTTGIQNAANRPFTHIKGEELFGKSEPPYCEKKTRFARNLDWLIPALGPQTVVVVYPSKNNTKAAATISWGGYIGGFSGINSEGVSCGLTLAPASLQAGTPNQLILRQTLELSDNLQSAIDTVENCISASSMNMMIVARDGMAILELDPERKKGGQKGPAFIHRH